MKAKDTPLYAKWRKKVKKIRNPKKEVKIGIVGKYYKDRKSVV